MNDKIQPRLLQGFRDLGPVQAENQLAIISRLQTTCRLFGYQPLNTPALEYADILLGKYGNEGEKLIYKFKDFGEREIALRYDLTVSLARYVAANFKSIPKPFKRYQFGPVWRAEKPQKGRFREFIQFDVDIVGSDSYQADAEMIALAYQFLSDLGIKDFKIMINSRTIFTALFESLGIDSDEYNRILQIIDKIDKIGLDSVAKELEAIGLDGKQLASIEEILKTNSSDIQAFAKICPEEVERLEKIISSLDKYQLDKAKIVFKPTLSRGLDYYTSFVFESVLVGAEEFGSVVGGGRFDKLISLFSNEEAPSVGLSVGVDRIADALAKLGIKFPSPEARVLVAYTQQTESQALEIASSLRQNGIATEISFGDKELGKKLKYADSKQIPLVIIIEDAELAENIVKIKDMKTGSQTNIALDPQEIVNKIKALI